MIRPSRIRRRNRIIFSTVSIIIILALIAALTPFLSSFFNSNTQNQEKKIVTLPEKNNNIFMEVFSEKNADIEINSEPKEKIHENVQELLLDSSKEKIKVIIQVEESEAEDVKQDIIDNGGEVEDSILNNILIVTASSDSLEEIAEQNSVKEITQNRVYHMLLDESTEQISAPVFWDNNITGKGVKVAVLDTGIAEHEMLEGKVIASEVFTGESTVLDEQGHGTHIAGIIAGDSTYRGVAPDASLLNAKVLNENGDGTTESILKGIEWAIQQDADIMSISIGGAFHDPDSPIHYALKKAIDAGIVVIIASGNCGECNYCGGFQGVTVPGDLPEAITVGAVDKDNNYACYSSGEFINNVIKPDIVAPGSKIISAGLTGYVSKTGTSMSTPHVAGAAALLLEAKPELSHYDIKDLFEKTALDLGEPGKDIKYGSGIIDLEAILTELSDITIPEITNNTNNNETIEDENITEEEPELLTDNGDLLIEKTIGPNWFISKSDFAEPSHGFSGELAEYQNQELYKVKVGVLTFEDEQSKDVFLDSQITYTEKGNIGTQEIFFTQKDNYWFWVSDNKFIWILTSQNLSEDIEYIFDAYLEKYPKTNFVFNQYFGKMDNEPIDSTEPQIYDTNSLSSQNTGCTDACDGDSYKSDLTTTSCNNYVNYKKKGTTYNDEKGVTHTDSCLDSSTLREYFLKCDYYGIIWCPTQGFYCNMDATFQTDKTCSDYGSDYECSNGACVSACDYDPSCSYTSKRTCYSTTSYTAYDAYTQCEGNCGYTKIDDYNCGSGKYCSGTQYNGVYPCYSCSSSCDSSCQSSNCYGYDPDCTSSGSVYTCCKDSQCSTGYECNNNQCVLKTCSDYSGTVGSCSWIEAGNTYCHPSEPDGDPVKCMKYDEIYCYGYIDECTSREYCEDPISPLEGAECFPYECTISSADWNIYSVTEGNTVTLSAYGSHCDGKYATFEIWESDCPDLDFASINSSDLTLEEQELMLQQLNSSNFTSQNWKDYCIGSHLVTTLGSIPFNSNKFEKSWQATYEEDVIGLPDYYFNVIISDEELASSENFLRVSPRCHDNDGDGYYAESDCGTTIDCDDNNDNKYPGNTETCDYIDNDCDNQVDENVRNACNTCEDCYMGEILSISPTSFESGTQGTTTVKVKNYGDSGTLIVNPNQPSGWDIDDGVINGIDWIEQYVETGETKDFVFTVTPPNYEDSVPSTWELEWDIPWTPINEIIDTVNIELTSTITCIDNDDDGYGANNAATCPHSGSDCDDSRASINPGATEVCDNIDNDCDSIKDDNLANCCNGESVDLGTDENNCGSCNNQCAFGQACEYGECVELNNCGNNICDPDETLQTCPADCQPSCTINQCFSEYWDACYDHGELCCEGDDTDADPTTVFGQYYCENSNFFKSCSPDWGHNLCEQAGNYFCTYENGIYRWKECQFGCTNGQCNLNPNMCTDECSTEGEFSCIGELITECVKNPDTGCLEEEYITFCRDELTCKYGQSTCQPRIIYTDIEIEDANDNLIVNKQPYDILNIRLKHQISEDIEFTYNTEAFMLIDGECYSDSITITEDMDCKFLVLERPGSHTFSLKYGDNEKVNIIESPETLIITDREKLFKRFSDDTTGVKAVLQEAYQQCSKDGVVYNLDDYVDGHPWDSFEDYNKNDELLLDESYVSSVSHFINTRCGNCKNVIILGDDFVVPYQRKNFEWRTNSEYSFQDAELETRGMVTDTAYTPITFPTFADLDTDKFFSYGQIILVVPPDLMDDSRIENLRKAIYHNYGEHFCTCPSVGFPRIDYCNTPEYGTIACTDTLYASKCIEHEVEFCPQNSYYYEYVQDFTIGNPIITSWEDVQLFDASTIGCNSFRDLDSATLILIGNANDNNAIQCLPWVTKEDYPQISIQRNVWDRKGHSLVLQIPENPTDDEVRTGLTALQLILENGRWQDGFQEYRQLDLIELGLLPLAFSPEPVTNAVPDAYAATIDCASIFNFDSKWRLQQFDGGMLGYCLLDGIGIALPFYTAYAARSGLKGFKVVEALPADDIGDWARASQRLNPIEVNDHILRKGSIVADNLNDIKTHGKALSGLETLSYAQRKQGMISPVGNALEGVRIAKASQNYDKFESFKSIYRLTDATASPHYIDYAQTLGRVNKFRPFYSELHGYNLLFDNTFMKRVGFSVADANKLRTQYVDGMIELSKARQTLKTTTKLSYVQNLEDLRYSLPNIKEPTMLVDQMKAINKPYNSYKIVNGIAIPSQTTFADNLRHAYHSFEFGPHDVPTSIVSYVEGSFGVTTPDGYYTIVKHKLTFPLDFKMRYPLLVWDKQKGILYLNDLEYVAKNTVFHESSHVEFLYQIGHPSEIYATSNPTDAYKRLNNFYEYAAWRMPVTGNRVDDVRQLEYLQQYLKKDSKLVTDIGHLDQELRLHGFEGREYVARQLAFLGHYKDIETTVPPAFKGTNLENIYSDMKATYGEVQWNLNVLSQKGFQSEVTQVREMADMLKKVPLDDLSANRNLILSQMDEYLDYSRMVNP